MDWGLTDEENRENAAVLDKHLQKLLDLPIETRQLLGIMVMRSYWNRYDCIVPIHEVERATGLKPENIIQNVEILERRGIISEIEVEEERGFQAAYYILILSLVSHIGMIYGNS